MVGYSGNWIWYISEDMVFGDYLKCTATAPFQPLEYQPPLIDVDKQNHVIMIEISNCYPPALQAS